MQSCSCILPLYACALAVCSSSSSDVQTPTLQLLAYLRSMIVSTLTDACICKLHLYILAGCGKQQTRNDRLFIAMRIVCHCLLKTFDANFPVWCDPLSKVYFPKCTFKSYFRKKNFQCVMIFTWRWGDDIVDLTGMTLPVCMIMARNRKREMVHRSVISDLQW